MIFLADECLNDNIVRGILRAEGIDLVRAKDVGLANASDPVILDWAANNERVILSHDSRTMTAHAYDRITQGRTMPGVLIVPAFMGVGPAIDDILLVHQLAVPEDFDRQVRYLPLS